MMKSKDIKGGLFLAISLMFCFSGFAINPVYVSPKGDDGGDGSFAHPFLTIEKARDNIRIKRSSGEKGSISILLRGGDYHFSHTVSFGKWDNNLIIKSYRNEKVRFTGGVSIDPLQAVSVTGNPKAVIFPESSRKHIFMVNLKNHGITDYGNLKQVGFGHLLEFSWMELFINGKPLKQPEIISKIAASANLTGFRKLIVQFNYFHNISDIHSSSAIYHDDGACGMKVFGNVFYKAGSKTVLIGGGSDNPYINSIFIDCKRTIDIDDRLQSYDWAMPWITPGNLFEQDLNEIRYNQPPYSLKYPELARYWTDNPGLPKRNVVDRNLFVRIGEVCNNFKRIEYAENNLVVHEDPGFVSEKDQNFRLKTSSEVFRKIPGFKQIPFEKIGIIKNGKPVNQSNINK